MLMLRSAGLLFLGFLALVLSACGGDGGAAAPSAREGATLVGTVVGDASTASAGGAVSASAAPSGALTVFVQEDPGLTATIAADGRFTLRGLPVGGFTLVFQSAGTTLGTLSFDSVAANQEITITVSVAAGGIVLVEQRRNGIGHGDLEVEGLVDEVLVLNPAGESRFLIDGHVIVARPGETSIREGNRSLSVADITVGRRVHVKAVWLPAEGDLQPALAHEIKLQGKSNGPGPGPKPDFCPDAGRKAEVEGKIAEKGTSDITVSQNGKGLFVATVDAGTRIRKGNRSLTFDELLVGNRVHVKGASTGLDGDACGVAASEIKLQN
jgi:hypothetical protein